MPYGSVQAPPSKSFAHRALIMAAMCSGPCTVKGIEPSQDVLATLDCLAALGKSAELKDNSAVFKDGSLCGGKEIKLYCRESGSTMRFFIPIALALGGHYYFYGSETLLKRPMDVYEDIFRAAGIAFTRHEDCFEAGGKLLAGEYNVRADVSSQFITGLIFALLLADGDSRIRLIPPVSSKAYIDITRSVIRDFGGSVSFEDELTIAVKGSFRQACSEYTVEGDYSNAAFLDALALLGGKVNTNGLNELSVQGDKVYKDHFRELEKGFAFINIDSCPDLGPVLFAAAAAKYGAHFSGTKRLRIKESDRCSAMKEELAKFGVSCVDDYDDFIVEPGTLKSPGTVICGHNDHRIVMAMSVLLTFTGGRIEGAEAVSKSFPDFFDVLRSLHTDVTLTQEHQ